VEEVLGRLGTAAHGVVTRQRLLRVGLTEHEIDHRLETGALIREHRGVYRVGHRAPNVEAVTSPLSWRAVKGRCCAAGRPRISRV
jgi:putative AbiEi antitoxin of type IV toxin-antitoxin system